MARTLVRFTAPILTAVLVVLCIAPCGCNTALIDSNPARLGPWEPDPNFLDAQLAQCPSAALLAIVKEAPVTFTGGIPADPVVCTAEAGSADLTRKQERVYQALIIMRQLRFDRPLPWTSETLWDWFIGQVREIRVSDIDKYSSCCGNDQHTIFINIPHEITDLSWRGFVPLFVMVHEARHIPGLAHTCDYTRDRTVDDLGASGVVYWLKVWLGSYSDPETFPIQYRALELYDACGQRNTSFCVTQDAVCQSPF